MALARGMNAPLGFLLRRKLRTLVLRASLRSRFSMKERRLFQRFKVDFPVTYTDLQNNKEGTGKMIDISAGGGGMIITQNKIEPSTDLEMHLEIPDNLEPLHMRGKVVWSMQTGVDSYRIGIQFEGVDFFGLSRALKFKIA